MANPSVYRTTKFAKYLPERGWRPIVLCVRPSRKTVTRDQALVDEISADVLVESVGADPLRPLYKASSGLLGRPGLGADWGRFRNAVQISRRLCRQHQIDAIYVSAPPKRLPILGMWVKRATGLPLINDFRDPPWQLEDGWRPNSNQRAYFEREYAEIFRCSDVLIANTDPVRDAMIARLGIPAARIVTIPNGYDEDDFAGLSAESKSPDRGTLQALCAGRMYKDVEVTFAKALEIAARDPNFRDRFRLRVLGKRTRSERSSLTDSLSHLVEFRGHVGNREAAAEMLRSDLNLVTCPDRTSALRVPQRLYPYLRAGRPILGLMSQGPASALVENLALGIVCGVKNAKEMAAALRRSFERWQAGWAPPPIPKGQLERFERRRLTGQLAACFDELADRRRWAADQPQHPTRPCDDAVLETRWETHVEADV
jgi:glycosyltransferase involved in cell wall biosynthesis